MELDYRQFMRKSLSKAAEHFGVTLHGKLVYGWRDRSISARVSRDRQLLWLRVVSEQKHWINRQWWEGNEAANQIEGISMPKVLDSYEWEDGEILLRAEFMTLMEGMICSSTPEIRHDLDLSEQWWQELRESLDRLAAWPTDRKKGSQAKINRRLLVFFGDDVDPHVKRWTTAHGDLHWSNLLYPRLTILDWEGWGRAPYGYDAATLYCYSLLQPRLAKRVYQLFADILDSRDGMITQLYVITRLLRRMDQGDNIDLAGPLHRHSRRLIALLRK